MYEINVSKNGKHLFATHERSLQDLSEAADVFVLFQEKFPESDGYCLTITKRTETYLDLTAEWMNKSS